jgi:3-hydroxyisobutyrate dehydrogenase-like beta-hydroxyacid dehydrogenase
MTQATTVSIFGLGIIGSRCTDCLLSAGYKIRPWNRTKGKHKLQIEKLETTVQSDVFCFYLKDGVACREVFNDLRPFLSELNQLSKGKTLINHSTVDLETTLWLAKECEKIGMGFLDCPFTGSKDASAEGNLVYYAGGELELLETHRSLLEVTSKEIHHLGKIGNATIVKITTNLISACTIQAISEAMAISLAHGITAEQLTQAVSSNASGSLLSKMKMPRMASGDFEAHFSLSNMLKDSKFALDLADQKGLLTPGIAATSKQMQALADLGHGDLDYSALIKQFDSSATATG